MEIIGHNYEVRIALINLSTLEEYNKNIDKKIIINNNTDDELFYDVAEKIGTIFTLGGFVKCINNNYVDISNLDSYLRIFLVDTDNQNNKLILLENSLIIKNAETNNEKIFAEYEY